MYCRVRPLREDESASCAEAASSTVLQLSPPECSLAYKAGHMNPVSALIVQTIVLMPCWRHAIGLLQCFVTMDMEKINSHYLSPAATPPESFVCHRTCLAFPSWWMWWLGMRLPFTMTQYGKLTISYHSL